MWHQNFLTDTPQRIEPAAAETDEEAVSSQLNTSNCGAFLEVDRNKLVVKYVGPGKHNNDVGSIQGNQPVPRSQVVYYYELLVKDKGVKGDIFLGFADKHFKMGRAPGWEPGSYGYNGMDGKRLHKSASASRDIEEYAEPFTAGDVVGAGIILGRQELFFTKNGRHLGVAFKNVCSVPLYPTIGLHSPGECVGVNFGRSPFIFDLDALVAQEQEMQQEAVSSMGLEAGAPQALVRDYLMHHGYADTLAAFERSCACAGEDGWGQESSSPQANGHRLDASPRLSNGHASPSSPSAPSPSPEQWLLVRRDVRQLIMAGDPQAASRLLWDRCPQVLDPRQAASAAPAFHLACLAFVELVRQGKTQQAVEYARTSLAPLRSLRGHNSSAYNQMLHDVSAILAYEHPEDAPEVKDLLDNRQREITADVVNHAMLATQPAPPWHSMGRQPPWAPPRKLSVMETILRQLLATHEALLETNGGFGVPFRLQDHLRPVQPPADLQQGQKWHLQ